MIYWRFNIGLIIIGLIISMAYYFNKTSKPKFSLIQPKYNTFNPNFTKELTLMNCGDEVINGDTQNRCAITYQRIRLKIDSIYSFLPMAHHLDKKKNIPYCVIYMADGNKFNVEEECQNILPWD